MEVEFSPHAVRLASIGVIFVVSFCAAGFPTAAQRVQWIRIPSVLFFLGKHFGTGVILSTAFIHLLSDAFKNLHELHFLGYANWPGAIVLGALASIFLVEYVSTVYVESVASHREASDKSGASPARQNSHSQVILTNSPTSHHSHIFDSEAHAHSPLSERSTLLPRRASQRDAYFDVYLHHHDHSHPGGHCDDEQRKDPFIQLLGALVLQIGIMIHSFVIGMTLAVTSAAHLTSLLTAITFHQLFEGLSLGVRLSTLPPSLPVLPPSSTHPRTRSIRFIPPLLTFLFGITTPAGIVTGLIIHHFMRDGSLNTPPDFVAGLSGAHPPPPGGSTFRGVMSAVSAGLLIYAGCVELLAGDFVMDADMRKSSRGRQMMAIVSLLCGAVSMALIK